ncbi:hypothetical protein RB653_008210 [Dictyostelium firmibasis]|uniref:PLD phosphodiesterase domain-containing protein n=1 Tax=Dictyostelium firmibasis TaxID=79012 RepID=A0AAN7UC87_9MYCE
MIINLFFIVFLFVNVNSIRINDESGLFSSTVNSCQGGTIQIAESIPLGLNITTNLSTHDAWMDLITNAQESIDLGFFYFTLLGGADLDPIYGGQLGIDIYNAIVDAYSRGIDIRIVQNQPSVSFPDTDTQALAKLGIPVRSIDWVSLVGSGILHTKLIIVDQSSAYVGSANADWSSLAQVKELGIVLKNCQTMVKDTEIAFQQYWDAANLTSLPISVWDSSTYQALYNSTNMASLLLNNDDGDYKPYDMFLAVSPPQFQSPYRTGDIDALINAINNAEESICIAVMDYTPTTLYNNPNTYWPLIDDALRAAAFNRDVQVRMLISHWNYTSPIIPQWLHSLDQIDNIQVRWFVIPDFSTNPQIPYTRVNHAKFMVTEKQSYVGTSNWSEDYFTVTGGLSYNVFNNNFTNQLQSIFDRDWNSAYTQPIQNF